MAMLAETAFHYPPLTDAERGATLSNLTCVVVVCSHGSRCATV